LGAGIQLSYVGICEDIGQSAAANRSAQPHAPTNLFCLGTYFLTKLVKFLHDRRPKIHFKDAAVGVQNKRYRATTQALVLATAMFVAGPAAAGNDANFVLYNQNTEEKGATEIELFSDFSKVGSGGKNYTAQLAEIEYGVTDLWTTSVYLEGAKTYGESYDFASFRFENRIRLFKEETLFNPVVYAEYEQKDPESRFVRSVVGRADSPEGPSETEHELETKLILGHDLTDRLNVAFNWINEIKFDNGVWSFGYAAGLNYALIKGSPEAEARAPDRDEPAKWDLEKLTLGIEFYGGLGDSVLGLTFDPDKTEQYAGVNLMAEFDNHVHAGIGGAVGLTSDSEDAILRLTAGYEFE
jgi:hypothetical protein